MNLLLSRLDEQWRRWYVVLKANRLSHGGVRRLAQITGLDEKTNQRGQDELAHGLIAHPTAQVRLPGGGQPTVEKSPDLSHGAPGVGGSGDGWRPDQ